jgi:hypothetical protein
MSFHLLLLRDSYTELSTVGKLFLNGDYFSETLEDVSRGDSIKINAKTCIPEGTYQVEVSLSNRFQRDMAMIYNQPNGYELVNKGISFKGIRIHGGNKHENTEGCILTAKNRINPDLIQGSMEVELTKKLIELGLKGFITVCNRI